MTTIPLEESHWKASQRLCWPSNISINCCWYTPSYPGGFELSNRCAGWKWTICCTFCISGFRKTLNLWYNLYAVCLYTVSMWRGSLEGRDFLQTIGQFLKNKLQSASKGPPLFGELQKRIGATHDFFFWVLLTLFSEILTLNSELRLPVSTRTNPGGRVTLPCRRGETQVQHVVPKWFFGRVRWGPEEAISIMEDRKMSEFWV